MQCPEQREREQIGIQSAADSAFCEAWGNDRTIYIEKMGKTRNKPVVIVVFIRGFVAKCDEKGNNLAIDCRHLAIRRHLHQHAQPLRVQPAGLLHFSAVECKDRGKIRVKDAANLFRKNFRS